MPDETQLIYFLGHNVMGWKLHTSARAAWNPIKNADDTLTLFAKARNLGKNLRLYASAHLTQTHCVVQTPGTNDPPVVIADDDPKRAICMAVAKAFGWKEEGNV